MTCINELPDDLLLKILSFLPAKDVLATMILSRRWQFLWRMAPVLFYDDDYHQDTEYQTFFWLVESSFVRHKEGSYLDTLHLKLGKRCDSTDLQNWVEAADIWSPRKLIMDLDSSSRIYPVILPQRLYTGCEILVSLKANSLTLEDVHSDSVVSFPSLRNLTLSSVRFQGRGFVKRFLSICPVLEYLVMERLAFRETNFPIIAPRLKTLLLHLRPHLVHDETRGFEIDAPSLEFLDIVDHCNGFFRFKKDMPNIIKANIDAHYGGSEKILSSICSVKQLYLCLPLSKVDAYPVGCIFHCLVRLKICTCGTNWLSLVTRLIGDSPKLRYLKLDQCHRLRDGEQRRPISRKPSYEPFLSNLESLEWINYVGSKEQKELVAFVLRSGSSLKNVTLSTKSTDPAEKIEMLKELMLVSRRSPNCQLAVN